MRDDYMIDESLWVEVFNKYKETVKEEPFEIKVKGFFEMRSEIPKECTCPTLLNGHWDGCPMRKE